MFFLAHRVGPTNPASIQTVTVYLNARAPVPSAHEVCARALGARGYLSRADYASTHGAHPDNVAAVKSFAAANNLTVAGVDVGRGAIELSGTIDALQRAFQVHVEDLEIAGNRFNVRQAPIVVPESLNGIISGIFGLHNQPVARPHYRRRPIRGPNTEAVGDQVPLTPSQIARLYSFPTDVNGAGQTIALIELGGGYSDDNLASYFASQGVSPAPQVSWVSVGGGQNQTGSDADGEVQLDIEVAGAVAPGAKIVVYFAADASERSFLDAVSQAIHDTTNNPTILSISWGGPEGGWSSDGLKTMDGFFQSAALLGISVFVAAGDNGSSDGAAGTNADFPASSPNCTACGGTALVATGGAISSETVWNDANGQATGGGVSAVFPVPPYQKDVSVPANPNTRRPGRGVPDICGNADPNTGYIVQVDGQQQVVGGTSAVAPLWAGLTALLNQSLGAPLAFLNPLIYSKLVSAGALNDITLGNNITDGSRTRWLAGPGGDPCTGFGSPNGAAIVTAIKAG